MCVRWGSGSSEQGSLGFEMLDAFEPRATWCDPGNSPLGDEERSTAHLISAVGLINMNVGRGKNAALCLFISPLAASSPLMIRMS